VSHLLVLLRILTIEPVSSCTSSVNSTCSLGQVYNNSSCQTCTAGKFAKLQTCTDCPVGKYSSTAGLTACTVCPKHSFAEVTGRSSCVSCAESYQTTSNGTTNHTGCVSTALGAGWITMDGIAYWNDSRELSAWDAQKACGDLIRDGRLVTLNTQAKSDNVYNAISKYTYFAWIGAYRSNSDSKFAWLSTNSSVAPGYTLWKNTTASGVDNTARQQANAVAAWYGYWYPWYGYDAYTFICEVPDLSCSQSNGWVQGNGYVFKLITTQSYSYSDAQVQCQTFGASLAVLSDNTNFNLVKDMALDFSDGSWQFWIGMKQDANSLEPEYGWKWSDGSDVAFWNDSVSWAPYYPWNNYIGGRNQSLGCGGIEFDGLVDLSCSSSYYAVCAKPGKI
jgi:hypothetical protein